MPEKTITITSPENYSNWNYYKTETVDFSGKNSRRGDITVTKTSETGLGASITTINYHIAGTNSFNGGDSDTLINYVTVDVNIKTVKQNTYTGLYSIPGTSYIQVQGSITIKIEWSDYIPQATTTTQIEPVRTTEKVITETELVESGVTNTPPARPQSVSSGAGSVIWQNYPVSPQSETEWVEQRRVLDEGINVKCIDLTHKEKHGFGEIRAEENIVNNLIPNETVAKRIGKSKIFESAKSLDISMPIPPNFAIKPRSFITTKISSLFLEVTEQVKSVEFNLSGNSQEYKVNFSCKYEPYLKEGKILLLNTATKQLEEFNFDFVLQKVRTEYTYPSSGYIYSDGNYCFFFGSSHLAVDMRTGIATSVSLPYEAYAYGCCFDGNFYDWESNYIKKYSPSGTVSLVFNFGGWTYYNIASNYSSLYICYFSFDNGGVLKVKEFTSSGTVVRTANMQSWGSSLVHFAVDDTYAYTIDGLLGVVSIFSLSDLSLVDSFTNSDLGSENNYNIIHFKVINSKIYAIRTNYGNSKRLVVDIASGDTEIDITSGSYTNIQII